MDTANGAVRMIPENVDGALLQRILDSHKPLDAKKFDAKPLLDAVEDIIRRVEGSNGKASQGDLGRMMEPWIHETIKKVSCELSCKCSGATANTREVALVLLQSLGSYSWEAKAVITLAAFAANYGSYLLVSQLYERNDPFVKSVAFLQLSPNQSKQTHSTFKSEALKVVKAILYLTKYIVDVRTFQSQNAMLTSIFNAYEDDLAKAVYLSILSTVASESLLMSTVALGYEYEPTATDAQVFSSLAIELKSVRMELGSQMESWKKYIEEIIVLEDYGRLVRKFKGTYTNNMEILKALLWKESQATMIYNCSTKMQEEMNKLSGKHVLLYFSNLEQLSEDEISILSEKYERKLTPYEIVWVPIMDESISWNEEIAKYFKKTRDSMPWYCINEPFKLGKAVIKYIKEVWKFKDRSQLVVLNPQGKFVKSGAVDLFWIWEKSVFASESTNIKEEDEQLWKGTMIQLLQDTLGETINEWIDARKYIFLFGGEDTKWIQEFVEYACNVVKDANIEFVMMYVGKSNLSWKTHQKIFEQKNPNFNIIFRFTEKKYMSSFWATLQSIWQTRVESGKSIVDDMTMENIVTLLSFDASAGGWAAICRGSSPKMAKAQDETILNLLKNYTTWAALNKQVGFVDALIQKIKEGKTYESYHDCYSLAVVANIGSTPKKVKCLICGKVMKSFITYSCCPDL
ncbi:protein SIEVE ELEMENT OCCLUSION B-like [Diospyros lotus]|uniref:protein SIEVE ELEMENT OCCLUSION B-like n=1 Tax=Diospyros lotus TaxID=55363 RepID=UPI0022508E75|nr:protein SIEVE ELEMENT OCCLUSION B-like [Diospyros lotus]